MVVILFLFMPQNGYSMLLVQDRKPQATIIIAEDCPDSVWFAASEFQKYVQKTTGALLSIKHKMPVTDKSTGYVLIGESDYTRQKGINVGLKKPDEFRIVSRDNWLVIMGKDYKGKPIVGMRSPWRSKEVYNAKLKLNAFGETGTLYGVYYFLHRFCGVRWYMPGELGEVIQPKNTLQVSNVDIKKAPDFEYRYVWLCDFADDVDAALWYKRTGFGAAAPVQIIDSFHFFLKYKDTHPEYFALINGRRDFTDLSSKRGGGNLDLSNGDVFKQWIADIRKYFDEHPEQRFYPLAPNDGMFKICECKDCQSQINEKMGEEGKYSDYIWGFIDRVAKEIYKSHPDKFIGCMAYEHYQYPPSKLKRLNPNVAVMIAKWRMFYNDPEYHKKMDRFIEGWRVKSNHIYIWEYYLNSWGVLRGHPVFFPHTIADDLRYLKKFSKGEFIEAETWQGSEPQKMGFYGMSHLNLYLTGKLFWNVNENLDDILNEYYRVFYGPAKEEMRMFWNLAEAAWMKKINIKEKSFTRFLRSKSLIDSRYDKETLGQMHSLLQNGLHKLHEGSIYHKRVKLIYSEIFDDRLFPMVQSW
ncbi:MAG: DUF4838 domain-containing protein [Deltaproteobacteria bacterium]|nr:DUF4838 domain-containing protein [Deltaproteobacteria bacterium]